MFNAEAEMKKWSAVLDHEGAPALKDQYKRAVTAKLLENTEKELRQQGMLTENITSGSALGVTAGGTGSVGFDPILISMVRRAMPNLIAYDIAGVQPMSAPTGLIFALKSRGVDLGKAGGNRAENASPGSTEILFNEADTAFSAEGTTPTSDNPLQSASPFDGATAYAGDDDYAPVGGVTTATAEVDETFPSAGFTIERATVTAKTRQLKAEYSMELAQDLKAVHGLDAESELANILSAEILAEINREVIRSINHIAKLGHANSTFTSSSITSNTHTDGIFDLKADADGRWMVEKYKSLVFQLEVEANTIAKETRRGKGNFVLCSSNVASALAAAGVLDYSLATQDANLSVDDTGNTFAGVLNGRLKVYIDPYAAQDYVTLGYRGTNPYDAGIFYCPYVPLTMVRAVDEASFQPKMAFKTRYGLQQHPFVGLTAGIGTQGANQYFRKMLVTNINATG